MTPTDPGHAGDLPIGADRASARSPVTREASAAAAAAHAPFRRYVMGPRDADRRYLKLRGGGSFVDNLPAEQGAELMRGLWADARRIGDDELAAMLRLVDWRPRIAAAWLIGLDRRTRFREALRELLLASELAYAGEGYAFALTRFAEPRDAAILVAFLERHLPTGLAYGQGYVLDSLVHLDTLLGTNHAARILDPAGPWWRPGLAADDPNGFGDRIARVSALVEETAPKAGRGDDKPIGAPGLGRDRRSAGCPAAFGSCHVRGR
ncbi:DUF6000 family protein [Catellatospora sichuanensis]|uniref:DUF6000 family protein n=1 Tax=Catellatospora sichuanensis TaxID=1969805 RepID=UPI001183B19B|nr:DUF6000 family protein [Catellatospora sichuanensis]